MLLGYSIVTGLLISVVVSGYWAFGVAVEPLVINSMARPTWLVVTANFMVVVNSLAGYLVSEHAPARPTALLPLALFVQCAAAGGVWRELHSL